MSATPSEQRKEATVKVERHASHDTRPCTWGTVQVAKPSPPIGVLRTASQLQYTGTGEWCESSLPVMRRMTRRYSDGCAENYANYNKLERFTMLSNSWHCSTTDRPILSNKVRAGKQYKRTARPSNSWRGSMTNLQYACQMANVETRQTYNAAPPHTSATLATHDRALHDLPMPLHHRPRSPQLRPPLVCSCAPSAPPSCAPPGRALMGPPPPPPRLCAHAPPCAPPTRPACCCIRVGSRRGLRTQIGRASCRERV